MPNIIWTNSQGAKVGWPDGWVTTVFGTAMENIPKNAAVQKNGTEFQILTPGTPLILPIGRAKSTAAIGQQLSVELINPINNLL